MKTPGICLLLSWAVLAAAEICKPVERLQAVEQSYKINANHVMFGLLGVCPPVGEQVDELLLYQITDGDLSGLNLMDERTGEFRFVPPPDFVGIVNFTYTVTDSNDRISQPARVTICVHGDPNVPQLSVHDVTSYEGTYVPLGIEVSMAEGLNGSSGQLTVALCNCNETLACERDTGRCNCILTLPDGWEFGDGLHRRLFTNELTNLPTTQLQNLTLKTQLYSAAQLCLDVHAVNWRTAFSVPLTITNKLLITITTSPFLGRPAILNRGRADTTHNALQLETSEGRVIRFGGLRVRDSDDMNGMYQVQVSLDKGGTLWVQQDESSDVIFFPKESDGPKWEAPTSGKRYRKLDRFGNFYKTNKMPELESANNGKKRLSFTGTLDGINRVLRSMVYVPWCPHWPIPPNWNLPESSWMDPSSRDRLISTDPMKPVIWPQWYPRFWYPFPRKNWSWWPRVLPPWWLNQTCSDWTSQVHVYVREVTPETCDREKDTDVMNWYADIHVKARGTEPKSLIADNLFNYFPVTSRSFFLRNLYIRSKEAHFNLRFTLRVLENQLARIENTDTNEPGFTCCSVPECNEQLQKIRVHLLSDTQDICKITIEIRMYKDDSERLSDYMMLWGYKAAPECTIFMHRDPMAAIELSHDQITIRQGETVPLGLHYSSSVHGQTGILHTIIYAEHGVVTVTARDGLRVYMDHMGQHERIPTYLCISGPTDMVIEALSSAKFTPLKNFKGWTTVKVDYTVPFTALKETFGIDKKPAMKRVLINIEVITGYRPYLPLLEVPSQVCISEMDLLPLDIIRAQGRFQQDERVSLSLLAGHGRLEAEPSRINEIYGCPEQIAEYQDTSCRVECSYHSACPGHQLCCHQGCSRICSEPQQVATVHTPNPHQVIIHGNISTINMVLEAQNVLYLSKPCQTDEVGELVTDRVIESQTDNIRLEVIPDRNPEGDSVFGNLLVRIKCALPVVKPNQEQRHMSEVRGDWTAWNECQLEGEVCGHGMQTRQRQRGRQRVLQERPCMICGCKPSEKTIVDPSPNMTGCTSDTDVKRCPAGCEVDSHHQKMQSFTCLSPKGGDGMVQRTKSIEVHDNCICSSCLTN